MWFSNSEDTNTARENRIISVIKQQQQEEVNKLGTKGNSQLEMNETLQQPKKTLEKINKRHKKNAPSTAEVLDSKNKSCLNYQIAPGLILVPHNSIYHILWHIYNRKPTWNQEKCSKTEEDC